MALTITGRILPSGGIRMGLTPPVFINATGGTITTDGDFRIHTFTSSGTFTVLSGTGTPDVLILGGGGGGAGGGDNMGGGGGGAGGLLLLTPTIASAGAASVTIGTGGVGGTYNNVASKGTDTYIAGVNFSTATFTVSPAGSSTTTMTITSVSSGTVAVGMILSGITDAANIGSPRIASFGTFNGSSGTVNLSWAASWANNATITGNAFRAVGGGRGGTAPQPGVGGSGGSGGGVSGNLFVGSPGSGNGAGLSGQGNSGSLGSGNYGVGSGTGGGGGGAGGAGANVTAGAGTASSISGSSITYAAGGRGGDGTAPVVKTANRGQGGDGGYHNSGVSTGSAGSSGVVIIRYQYQ